MSNEIEITLKVTVKKLSREDADDKGHDSFNFKSFDLDLVDKDVVASALVDYFETYGFDDIEYSNYWPWEIVKLEKTL